MNLIRDKNGRVGVRKVSFLVLGLIILIGTVYFVGALQEDDEQPPFDSDFGEDLIEEDFGDVNMNEFNNLEFINEETEVDKLVSKNEKEVAMLEDSTQEDLGFFKKIIFLLKNLFGEDGAKKNMERAEEESFENATQKEIVQKEQIGIKEIKRLSCDYCKCSGESVECIGKNEVLILEGDYLNNIPTSVKLLRLRNLGIKELPFGSFDKFVDLEVLDLSFNELESLPVGIFDKLTKLQELDLNNNKIKSLPEGIFDKTVSLTGLTMSSNKLIADGLPVGLFDNLRNLRLLDIAINPLGEIPVGLFDGLLSLDYLSAYETNLVTLPSGSLNKMSNLVTLEMPENVIRVLPDGIFANNKKLESVIVSMNWLQKIPESVFNLPNLKSLGAGDVAGFVCLNREISKSIEIDFEKCSDIDNNGRVERIGTLGGIEELNNMPTNTKHLILRNNNLESLPVGIFDRFTEIESIDLGHNKLRSLPVGIFDKNVRLKKVYLAFNELSSLPDGLFSNNKKLEEISLGFNKLRSLPNGLFEGLSNVVWLHLEFNPIEEFNDGVFDGLKQLEYLGVFNLKLKELPIGIFDENINLQEIDLTENYFKSLPRGLFDNQNNMGTVSLIGNKLISVRGLFDNARIEKLVLESNPGLVCSDVIGKGIKSVEPEKC